MAKIALIIMMILMMHIKSLYCARLSTKHFACIKPHFIIIEVRYYYPRFKDKDRQRTVKQPAWEITANKWQKWDSNPGNLAPEPMVLTIMLKCTSSKQLLEKG